MHETSVDHARKVRTRDEIICFHFSTTQDCAPEAESYLPFFARSFTMTMVLPTHECAPDRKNAFPNMIHDSGNFFTLSVLNRIVPGGHIPGMHPPIHTP